MIVLDSLTRMARAHNTAERGTGRTLSGGLDATAMARPPRSPAYARAAAASGASSLSRTPVTVSAPSLIEPVETSA